MPVRHHVYEAPFVTEGGAVLEQPVVAYQTWGVLNAARDNVVIVCHALTGHAEADEWFAPLFGLGRVCDPERHFIVCQNVLGSCYGTAGPPTLNPATGRRYGGDFPVVTVRDMVRFQQRLLDDLDVTGIQLVLGPSLGGMQALEWALMDRRVQRLLLFACGKAHTAWQIGLSEAQRQAIYLDPRWQDGHYDPADPPAQGLAVARMMGMVSYRSAVQFEARFGRALQPEAAPDAATGRPPFAVESYLRYQGQKLVDRFDAAAYVRLTQAMDSHDVGRGRGTPAEVLGRLTIPACVVGITSDVLYPLAEQEEIVRLLGNGQLVVMDSDFGHDGFLVEFDKLLHLTRPFLEETGFVLETPVSA